MQIAIRLRKASIQFCFLLFAHCGVVLGDDVSVRFFWGLSLQYLRHLLLCSGLIQPRYCFDQTGICLRLVFLIFLAIFIVYELSSFIVLFYVWPSGRNPKNHTVICVFRVAFVLALCFFVDPVRVMSSLPRAVLRVCFLLVALSFSTLCLFCLCNPLSCIFLSLFLWGLQPLSIVKNQRISHFRFTHE